MRSVNGVAAAFNMFDYNGNTRVFRVYPGLYLECNVRGCNGRAGGLGDGSPPQRGPGAEPR